MYFYRVRTSDPDRIQNTQYLWIVAPVDGDTRDMENVAILRSDYRFVFFRDRTYRVCQVELEDDDDLFIKFWVEDPFEGFEDYEQIGEARYMPDPEYSI